MSPAFPIKVPISHGTLWRWQDDERASWEDAGMPADGHVYTILGRAKTRVIVNDATELEWLIQSAYDVSAWWDDRPAYRAAVGRIRDRLADARLAVAS